MEMRGRRRRLSLLAGAYTAAVLVALAALAVFSARRSGRLDVTHDRRHSLQPATLALLESMPEGAEPVDMLAITSAIVAGGRADEAEAQVGPLLQVFARSSGRVRARVLLAEHEPALVDQLAIDHVPVVLLSWQPPTPPGGAKPPRRERRTLVATEAGIASALRELIEDRKRIAYLLVGHGELRQGEQGPASAALMATTLQGLNFETRELALVGAGDVPQDADLLVVAGPQSGLLKEELAAFDRYMDRGGRFLVLDGPTRDPDDLLLLHAWLSAQWNLGPADGVVADFDVPLGADPRVLLVLPKAEDHPIASGLQRLVQLPLTRSIRYLDRALPGVTCTAVLRSGPQSWLETNLEDRVPKYDEGEDLRGPLAIAWAATRRRTGDPAEARLVVFGTRMAFADQHLAIGANMDLLRNTVDWATGREADIAARQGGSEDGTVVVADRQGRIIITSMLVVPAIVSLTGVAMWWRRRRL